MNILYFGDGIWAQKALQKLLCLSGINICGVVLRYSKQDNILREIAEKNNVKIYIEKNVNSIGFLDQSNSLNIDLGVSMSFDQIIKKPLRDTTKKGFINCHAGKLPNYRGRNIINWALINDEKELGITAHYIDDGIDTGDIISQKIIKINAEDNYKTLLDKAIEKCPEVLIDSILKIKNNNINIVKQNNINGSYFSFRRNGDEFIDWNWGSRRIHNFIRALVEPSPGAQTFIDEKKIYIWSSEETDFPNYISTPGEIVRKSDDGIFVKTGDSVIKIKLISYSLNLEKIIPDLSVGKRLGLNLYEKIFYLEKKLEELNK